MNAFLQHPFFYCVVGALAAMLMEWVRNNFWGGTIGLGFLIVLYAFLSDKSDVAKRTEVGDNCYIIGFIYTLVIVATTLHSISPGLISPDSISPANGATTLNSISPANGELQDELQVGMLLSAVGIALSTSVVGMMLRFLLQHGIKPPENEIEDAISRAAEAANRMEGVVTSLGGSIADVKNAMPPIAEVLRECADKVREESENIGKYLNETVKEVADSTEKSVRDSLFRLDNTVVEIQDRMKLIGSVVETHRRVADELAKSLEQSKAHLETVEKTLKNTGKTIGDTTTSAGKSLEVLHNSVAKAADSFTVRVDKVSEGLRKIAEQQAAMMQAADGDVKHLRATMDLSVKELSDDVKVMRDMKEKWRQELTKVEKEVLADTNSLYARLRAVADREISELENK